MAVRIAVIYDDSPRQIVVAPGSFSTSADAMKVIEKFWARDGNFPASRRKWRNRSYYPWEDERVEQYKERGYSVIYSTKDLPWSGYGRYDGQPGEPEPEEPCPNCSHHPIDHLWLQSQLAFRCNLCSCRFEGHAPW
jgi:hypothetical protein